MAHETRDAAVPPARTMAELVDTMARFGAATALTVGSERVSYGELVGRVLDLQAALSDAGLRRGDRFAFLLPNSIEIIVCYLATARAGLVGVPLAARTTPEQLQFQLRDSGAGLLLHAEEFGPAVAGIGETLPALEKVPCAPGGGTPLSAAFGRSTDDGAPATDHPGVAPEDPFCVMYTGGTTGLPKAAVQTHAGWVAAALGCGQVLGIRPRDRHVTGLPMTHAAWFSVAAHLAAGAHSHVLTRWDPRTYLEVAEDLRATNLHMIPTLLSDVVAAYEDRPHDLGSVELVTLAGSAVPAGLMTRAEKVFGPVIGNIYGMTETAGPATYATPDLFAQGGPDSAGRPAPLMQARIAAVDGSGVVASGPGELQLRGPQVTPGYLNRPEETAEAFTADGWFRTGDIAHVDDLGNLHVVDRLRNMIKTGGFNVYPQQVEDVLSTHPSVTESAVIGLPDERWMERVVAVVVVSDDTTGEELRRHCADQLPGYQVPKDVEIVSDLPRTAFGKLDRRRLRAARQGAEPSSRSE